MVWKTLDTNSEYEISDTGLVRKVHMQKQWTDRDGYQLTTTTINGVRRNSPVHRLVLHAFDPRPNEEELEVHHIDGNPANNNLENLMWVTHEENIGFISKDSIQTHQFISRQVAQYDLNGNFIASFKSMNEAGKITGCNYRHIGEVCAGKRKTTGGFKWKYFEGSTTNCSKKSCEMGDFSLKENEDIV